MPSGLAKEVTRAIYVNMSVICTYIHTHIFPSSRDVIVGRSHFFIIVDRGARVSTPEKHHTKTQHRDNEEEEQGEMLAMPNARLI